MDTGGLINFLRPPSGGEQRQHDLMGREGRKESEKRWRNRKEEQQAKWKEREAYTLWGGGEKCREKKGKKQDETESTHHSVIY